MSEAYVRGAIMPPLAPPTSERGVVKWGRENLFSGWVNVLLTLISCMAILALLNEVVVWALIDAHWAPKSLGGCRLADSQLPPRAGFQLSDLFVLPIVFLRELFGGIFNLESGRLLTSPFTAVRETWQAMNVAPSPGGACWAVIKNRWYQFIFGFYPPQEWWRPTIDFALMFVALAPVLFADNARKAAIMVGIVSIILIACLVLLELPTWPTWVLPLAVVVLAGLTYLSYTDTAKLLWVAAIFPFLSVFLVWGGSVWGPVMAMLGFGVMALAYLALSPKLGLVIGTALGIVAACVWWVFLAGPAAALVQSYLPFGLLYIESDQIGGFLLAFVIGVASISISLPIGILFALGRQSNMFLIHTMSVGFIEFVRGVPLITMLFTASLLLQYFLPPGNNFDLILRVVILVTLFSAAYNAEVVRGGLAALPRGQYEAADALGLDYWQAQRLIIMPQALKVSIPGIVSTFIGLFKDTTLVSFVGLRDPLRGITAVVRADSDWKGIYWEPYIFVAAIFFVVCFGMSRYSMYLEGKLKTDHR